MAASPLQTLPLSALAKQTIHEVTQLHFKSLEHLKSKKWTKNVALHGTAPPPPSPPFVCTVIVIILLHLVWQHIAEISVVKKYWLILSKVWMFTMTLTSRLQSKTPSWRARQVVKHMSDLGNQHHNGPHEDQSFNNPFALCLWLWAKN